MDDFPSFSAKDNHHLASHSADAGISLPFQMKEQSDIVQEIHSIKCKLDGKTGIESPSASPVKSLRLDLKKAYGNVQVPRLQVFHRISLKIREAKFIKLPKEVERMRDNVQSIDYFCATKFDSQNEAIQKTQLASSKNINPFWAEDFKLVSEKDFSGLRLILYAQIKLKNNVKKDIPIGKVVIPKNTIKSGQDCWFVLSDAFLEERGTGRVNLDVEYTASRSKNEKHTFRITLNSANNLFKEKNLEPNSYAYLYLLPQLNEKGLKSKIIHNSSNPNFNETFIFEANEFDFNQTFLYISFWNDTDTQEPPFLGHCFVSLSSLFFQQKLSGWFSLRSLSDDKVLHNNSAVASLKKISVEKNLHPVCKIIKSLDTSFSIFPHSQHCLCPYSPDDNPACNQCSKIINESAAFFCSNCYCTIHEGCKDDLLACCNSGGVIKLSLSYMKQIILDLSYYQNMIYLLKERKYELLCIIGKTSPQRDEIAKCLIRIFDSHYLTFLKTVLQLEIEECSDSATLFRANSIGSKALDVFMKHAGQAYLIETLQKPLQEIANSTLSIELDPSKITSPDEIVSKNVDNLIETVESITNAILESNQNLPVALKVVFKCIQEAVLRKFPQEETAKYSSVSCFLFLRFLTPAIMNPYLFNIQIDSVNEPFKRKSTLIAKVVQNLSNLMEFGKKEPYMEPLNQYINAKIPLMKTFLGSVCEMNSDYDLPPGNYASISVLTDYASLASYLEQSLPKLPPNDLVSRLNSELKKISNLRDGFEYSLQHLSPKPSEDTDIDDGIPVISKYRFDSEKNHLENPIEPLLIYRVSGKLIEAKNLGLSHDQFNSRQLFCTASTDIDSNCLVRSATVANSLNPYWGEYFKIDSTELMNEVKIILWNQKNDDNNLESHPLAKVILERGEENEQSNGEGEWFSMTNASYEDKVTGTVQVKIAYLGEKEKENQKDFLVTLKEAKDLYRPKDGSVSAFAVMHLLPDPNLVSTKQTAIFQNSQSPNFDESFVFSVPSNADLSKYQIHISLWNASGKKPFIGHCYIPIHAAIEKDVDKLQNLNALPDDLLVDTVIMRSKSQSKAVKSYGKDLMSLLQSFMPSRKYTEKVHKFVASGSMLSQASQVFGNILLQIKFIDENNELKVRLEELKDIPMGDEKAQFTIVMHVLPDSNFATTKKHEPLPLVTHCILNEEHSFFIQAGDDQELYISIWDEECAVPFLGHLFVPLDSVIHKKENLHKWFPISTINDPKMMSFLINLQKAKASNSLNRDLVKEMIKLIHLQRWELPKSTNLDPDYFFKCIICHESISETPLLCSECFTASHSNCIQSYNSNCGASFKLRYDFVNLLVHDLDAYKEFVSILKEQDYRLIRMLGNATSQKEDVTRLLFSISNQSFLDMTEKLLLNEIRECIDHKALFQTNSMAMKAIDLLIMQEGGKFVKQSLEKVLREVIEFNQPFEIDPTKLANESRFAENLENLKSLVVMVLESIFRSADDSPKILQYLVSKIQRAVKQRFPDNESIKYTCISGIIFDRLLIPAIVCPPSYPISIGDTSDELVRRKLLLIAKTIQNISHITDFEIKEHYMQCLNPFIQLYKSKMMTFLEQISSPIDYQPLNTRDGSDFELAKDCAELVNLVSHSMEKMQTGGLLYSRLELIIKKLLVDNKDKSGEHKDVSFKSPLKNRTKHSNSEVSGLNTGVLFRLASKGKKGLAELLKSNNSKSSQNSGVQIGKESNMIKALSAFNLSRMTSESTEQAQNVTMKSMVTSIFKRSPSNDVVKAMKMEKSGFHRKMNSEANLGPSRQSTSEK